MVVVIFDMMMAIFGGVLAIFGVVAIFGAFLTLRDSFLVANVAIFGIFIEGGHVFSKVATSFRAYGDLATCRLKFTNLISELRKPSPRLARKLSRRGPSVTLEITS